MSSDLPQAVRVHVVSAEPGVMPGAGRPRRRAAYQTVTLSTNELAENILPQSGNRKIAFIVPLDQAVIIGNNKSDVAAQTGAIIPQNVAWPIEDDAAVYAAPSPALTGGSTARIAIQTTYEET